MTRLLLVEDNREMRALIGIALDDPALTIAGEAASAADALALASELQPDVIILDHFLDGDTTGLELAPALVERVPGTKILLFSSHDLSDQVRLVPSVHGYLRKSQAARLLEAVRALLAA